MQYKVVVKFTRVHKKGPLRGTTTSHMIPLFSKKGLVEQWRKTIIVLAKRNGGWRLGSFDVLEGVEAQQAYQDAKSKNWQTS